MILPTEIMLLILRQCDTTDLVRWKRVSRCMYDMCKHLFADERRDPILIRIHGMLPERPVWAPCNLVLEQPRRTSLDGVMHMHSLFPLMRMLSNSFGPPKYNKEPFFVQVCPLRNSVALHLFNFDLGLSCVAYTHITKLTLQRFYNETSIDLQANFPNLRALELRQCYVRAIVDNEMLEEVVFDGCVFNLHEFSKALRCSTPSSIHFRNCKFVRLVLPDAARWFRALTSKCTRICVHEHNLLERAELSYTGTAELLRTLGCDMTMVVQTS